MKLACFSPNSAFWLLCVSFLFFDGTSGSGEEKDHLPGDGSESRDFYSRRLPASNKTKDQLPPEGLGETRHRARSLLNDSGVKITPPDLSHAIKAVALVISGGKTTYLVGQTVRLTNIFPEFRSPPLPLSASFEITLSLGINQNVLFVLADGIDVKGFYCLGFFVLAANSSLSPATIPAAFEAELKRPWDVLSDAPMAAVGKGRGPSWSQYMADIDNAPLVTLVDDVFVFSRVLIIGGYSGNVGYVLSRHRSLPHNLREYLARRLMVLVLLLQQAGIEHDDFEMRHIFMRRGGSSILSMLSALSRFVEEVKRSFSSVSFPFSAPELLLATQKSRGETRLSRSEDAPPATAAADMWSLGAMLFFIFTGKFLAHGMTHFSDNLDGRDTDLAQLPEAQGQKDNLDLILKASEVPDRWRELILKLLRRGEKDRLSAEEVLVSFSDLLGLTS
ncbi:hypothetical protein Emag_002062 [Eimeria magna]